MHYGELVMRRHRNRRLSFRQALPYLSAGVLGVIVAAFAPKPFSDLVMIVALGAMAILAAIIARDLARRSAPPSLLWTLWIFAAVAVIRLTWMVIALM